MSRICGRLDLVREVRLLRWLRGKTAKERPPESQKDAGARAEAIRPTQADENLRLPSETYVSKTGDYVARQDDLLQAVNDLRQAVPELSGVMVASSDGLAIAHDFPDALASRVAAMAATALGLGKRIAQTTERGNLEETVVRGSSGYLIVYSAGDKGVLAVAAPSASNLGLIHLEARGVAQEVARLLS